MTKEKEKKSLSITIDGFQYYLAIVFLAYLLFPYPFVKTPNFDLSLYKTIIISVITGLLILPKLPEYIKSIKIGDLFELKSTAEAIKGELGEVKANVHNVSQSIQQLSLRQNILISPPLSREGEKELIAALAIDIRETRGSAQNPQI